MRGLLILILSASLASGASLKSRVDALLESSHVSRRSVWGVHVVDLATGKTAYARNENSFFVPASNTKLFSTALALSRLGPDHRFPTLVLAAAPPGPGGVVQGDLVLAGRGDPTLSARVVPYRKGPAEGNPLGAVEALASQVAARGVRRVAGDIVGDDTAFVWDPYPEGWAVHDAVWEYGAPVSALIVNDNAFRLIVRPGARPGDPARIALSPALEYFEIDNQVATAAGGERAVRVHRAAGSRELRIWGRIPVNESGSAQLLAVDDPARFAAWAFRDALVRAGVAVDGSAGARHRYAADVPDLKSGPRMPPPAGVVLARRESPPLIDCLSIVNKVSQNLHAEVMLREVGRVRRNVGSREAGLEEMKLFLAEAGIPEGDYNFEDGSGLSRLTLITPSAVTRLLVRMYRTHGDAWVKLMPLGGVDGTLAGRFAGTKGAKRVFAKTGTLSHVSALGGYVESRGRLRYAFSIVVNNYNAPAAAVRGVIDKVALLLAE